ncbi:MAG: hypothetical protein E6K69_09510 [Nitrospirae bacterium]|nr:MAG: hypothetical protein E6K69_09510 [Nitrospirota bacterium]
MRTPGCIYLRDAVALARPSEAGGNVVLQTYLPTHHAIASVVGNNESGFYDQELAFRQSVGYPPFTHLVSLRVSGTDAGLVREAAERWSGLLKAALQRGSTDDEERPAPHETFGDDVTILGPVPGAVARVRGRHRWQLLVKSAKAEAARLVVKQTLDVLEKRPGGSRLKFDVDVRCGSCGDGVNGVGAAGLALCSRSAHIGSARSTAAVGPVQPPLWRAVVCGYRTQR